MNTPYINYFEPTPSDFLRSSPFVSYDRDIGLYRCSGAVRSMDADRKSIPYSLSRYAEYAANGRDDSILLRDGTRHVEVALKDFQGDALRALNESYFSDSPGFLYADPPGSGKMITTALWLRDNPDIGSILVISPTDAKYAWMETIKNIVGDGGKRWLVTHYEASWRLLEVDDPDSVEPDRRMAGYVEHGRIRWDDFDVIVVDESHKVSNSDTLRFGLVDKLAEESQRNPFVVFMSATPVSKVSEMNYIAQIIEWGLSMPDGTGSPIKERIEKVERRLGGELKLSDLPGLVCISRPMEGVGMNTQDRSLAAVTLTPEEMRRYEETWAEFRRSVGMAVREGDDENTDSVTVEITRHLQKSSIIKAGAVARAVDEMVRRGDRVVVVCQYIETMRALHESLEALSDKTYSVLSMSGEDNPTTRSAKIQLFREGMVDREWGPSRVAVMITSIKESVSLQSEGGESTITVVADIMTGGKRSPQSDGRAHRDGKESPVLYTYAKDTIDERLLKGSLLKSSGTMRLVGRDDEADEMVEMSRALRSDILIPGSSSKSETDKIIDMLS